MIPLDVLPLPLVAQTKWCAIPQQQPLTTHVPQLDGVKICLFQVEHQARNAPLHVPLSL